jgi:hypothetical protein
MGGKVAPLVDIWQEKSSNIQLYLQSKDDTVV